MNSERDWRWRDDPLQKCSYEMWGNVRSCQWGLSVHVYLYNIVIQKGSDEMRRKSSEERFNKTRAQMLQQELKFRSIFQNVRFKATSVTFSCIWTDIKMRSNWSWNLPITTTFYIEIFYHSMISQYSTLVANFLANRCRHCLLYSQNLTKYLTNSYKKDTIMSFLLLFYFS